MTQVFAYNELTRLTGQVPENHLKHPILGANLREVRSGKRRGRMSEIVTDAPAENRREKRTNNRMTDTVAPDPKEV